MKKLLPSLLPGLALLTLGGCASTSYLTTTENDGMYYSASDKVVATLPAAPALAPDDQSVGAGDVANPDYTGSTASSGSPAEYYDDDYYYASRLRRFHSPYRGSSLGYYDFAYTDPFWYGGAAYAYPMYPGFGFADPFYSPFYGYGGVNVFINVGRPWFRPYGLGFGYSPFDYYYNRPWGGWGGGYGYGYNGYYGGGWNGFTGVDNYRPGRSATYGGRRDRAGDGSGLTTAGGAASNGRRRVQEGGFTSPPVNGVTSSGATQPGSRRRVQEPAMVNGSVPTTGQSPDATTLGRRGRQVADQASQDVPTTTPGTPEGGRRWRVLDNTTGGTVATPGTQPDNTTPTDYGRRRRADWNPGSGTTTPGTPDQPRVADQPRRQRLVESTPAPASEPARTYSQPRRSQPARTYSEPSRSYSQPSRSESSGSYSSPSRSSGSSSGGSSGGGGGRRR
ncbi:hypothetical protein KLP40_07415 [Hymenobacter sp. NST-14]|uniref:hypothetical protein n=1 Tax=Hymenobacter piscis TaxID=2839984 RepID=UPI001C0392D9|nr:hypothetical protein [Hymenobacter piscis]MBT9392986.1 hypothetical protein [Hymenobacter piscis]